MAKAIRMQKLQAMGGKVPMGKGAGNTFKMGNAGQGAIPGANKTMPSTVPSKLATKAPKGTK